MTKIQNGDDNGLMSFTISSQFYTIVPIENLY
jgi:hypothetical protein